MYLVVVGGKNLIPTLSLNRFSIAAILKAIHNNLNLVKHKLYMNSED